MESDVAVAPTPPCLHLDDGALRALVAVCHAEIGGDVPGDLPPLSPAVEADLRERGLLERAADGALHLSNRVEAGIIEVLTRSQVQLEVIRAGGGPPERRWYALTPQAAVALSPANSGWNLTPMLTRDILVRLAVDVALTTRPAARVDPLEVTGDALERCAERLALGDRHGAEHALGGAAASPLAVRAFVSALAEKRSTTAVIRTTSDRNRHVTSRQAIAWLDAGPRGLWAIPVPDRDRDDDIHLHRIAPLRFTQVCVAVARLLPLDADPAWKQILLPDPDTLPVEVGPPSS